MLQGLGRSLRSYEEPAVGVCAQPAVPVHPGCKLNHFIPRQLLAAGRSQAAGACVQPHVLSPAPTNWGGVGGKCWWAAAVRAQDKW